MTTVPTHILERIKSLLPLSDVIGRTVQLQKKGREFSGLCPFHQEKTPSFTVNDQKGFYHCFGCGAHGSLFDFLMFQEKLTFPESVEKAAQMANIPLPKQDAATTNEKQQEKKHKDQLLDILTLAQEWFQKNLYADTHHAARDYLKKRGLSAKTIETFALGFAPDKMAGLHAYLNEKGIEPSRQIEAGLLIKPEDTKKSPYDRFRGRLIFPISSHKNQVIGFGGRILNSEQQPKYLNSPETPLFHKGYTLYNHLRALHAKQEVPLLLVEGYMDVIALYENGYERAVAPLGTAVTEHQIALMWKIDPQPVMTFDGDNAGKRAAMRSLERALPLLKPGYSLSFLTLPPGEDPDSLIKKMSLKEFIAFTETKVTLIDYLWQHFLTLPHKTPEQKAFVEMEITRFAHLINHQRIRQYYRDDLLERLRQLTRPAFTQKRVNKKMPIPISADQHLEKILVSLIISYPKLIEKCEETLLSLHFKNKDLQQIVQMILEKNDERPLEKETLLTYLQEKGFSDLLAKLSPAALSMHAAFLPHVTSDAEAMEYWQLIYDKLHFVALQNEKALLKQRLLEEPSEENWQRYQTLCQILEEKGKTID